MTLTASYLGEFGFGDIDWGLRLAVDPTTGDVLVGDDDATAILRFDPDGTLLDTYTLPVETGDGISGVAVTGEGKIWATNFYTRNYTPPSTIPSLYRLAADGEYEQGFFFGPFGATVKVLEPTYVHVGGDGKLYVASSFYTCVTTPTIERALGVRLASDGAWEADFGEFIGCGPGSYPLTPPEGKFVVPGSIAADSAGNVYVADLYAAGGVPVVPRYKTIHKFNSAGEFQVMFGGVGTGDGQFTASDLNTWYGDGMGMTVDADDRIYVADTYGGKVNVYDTDGTFLLAFGADEALSYPADVACGSNGLVYVVDGDRVHSYQISGGETPDFMIRGISIVVCGDTTC